MQWRPAMATTLRVAYLGVLLGLTACNAVVFPSFGSGGETVCEDCNDPTPQPPPPNPRPQPEPVSCVLPSRVTAEADLVRESMDAGAPTDGGVFVDGGDAAPPAEPVLTSLDIEVDFAAFGGTGVYFGSAATCTGCEIRRTSFKNAASGTITIRVPHTPGTVSAFAPAAIRVPFTCGGTLAVLTLKVFQKNGDSQITVEGYTTN